jgi:hypothetical protein
MVLTVCGQIFPKSCARIAISAPAALDTFEDVVWLGPLLELASRAGASGARHINSLSWQTYLAANIDRNRISAALANRA